MIAKLLPTWIWAAAIAALVALLGLQTVRHARLGAQYATYRATMQEAARKASEEQRRIETERQAGVEKEAQYARDEIQALQANVVLLADTADSLRDALAAAKRRARSHPGAPVRGTPADTTIDLLGELFARADAEAGVLAEHADRARIAGLACEKSYGALTGDRHE